MDVMARDGKVAHATARDLGMSIITMARRVLYGGSPPAMISFVVTFAWVVTLCLPWAAAWRC